MIFETFEKWLRRGSKSFSFYEPFFTGSAKLSFHE
jgi:hypothetical protein